VVGTGDLNADGNVDVLWRHSNGTLSAWLLDPHGAVTRSLNLSRTCDPRTCAAGNPVGLLDLDGDGLTDLLWHNPGTGAVTAWLLDNAGTVIGDRSLSWQCGQSDACSSSWRIVGTMDANGDGKRDLLWHNATTGQLSAWLLDKDVTGTQDLSWTCTRATGCADSWQVVGAGDFNGDVNADLLWFNRQTGESSVWLTNGHGRVTGSESLSIRCDGTPINAPLTTFSGCSQAWNPVGLVGVR
jgi:hypothetical protein